ncbi:MAG: DNA pilot protein [Microviridae sp.]|nr:MAG: DNA pilot protein [Microviridae sp.]
MAIPGLIIPAISGIAGLIGNIISQKNASKTARINTDLTNKANLAQAKYAYTQEQANIEAQNKYNSPEAQMARFEKAGLNKNLIYTQGNPGNQSQIAKYQSPSQSFNYVQKFDPGKALISASQLMSMAQSIRNSVLQGKIMEAEKTIKTAESEFARTIELNKLRMSNLQLNQAQLNNIMSMREFTEFFTQDSGIWELKPGKEKLFLDRLSTKFLTPVYQAQKYQAEAGASQINLDYLESYKKLGIAVPVLKPFMDFLFSLILKQK